MESQITKGGKPASEDPDDEAVSLRTVPMATAAGGFPSLSPMAPAQPLGPRTGSLPMTPLGSASATPLPNMVRPSAPMSAQPLPGTPLPVAGMSATPMPSVAGSYGTPGGAPLFPAAGLGSGAPTVPVRPVQVVQPAAVAVAVPAAPVPIDPIAEAPEAIWYVRPPSGGQYGPARGEIMRKWVAEGRVSADSLVWREGWDDWRTGGEAFPVLRSTTPPVPGPIAYAPSGVPTSAARVPVRRRSSLPLAITTVVVLGFLALGLLITLVFVIRS